MGDRAHYEPETDCTLFRRDGKEAAVVSGVRNGGIRPQSERGDPASWIPYFTVVSTDAAWLVAEPLGARALLAPTAFDDERIAVLSDPQGAVFVLFEGHTDP